MVSMEKEREKRRIKIPATRLKGETMLAKLLNTFRKLIGHPPLFSLTLQSGADMTPYEMLVLFFDFVVSGSIAKGFPFVP